MEPINVLCVIYDLVWFPRNFFNIKRKWKIYSFRIWFFLYDPCMISGKSYLILVWLLWNHRNHIWPCLNTRRLFDLVWQLGIVYDEQPGWFTFTKVHLNSAELNAMVSMKRRYLKAHPLVLKMNLFILFWKIVWYAVHSDNYNYYRIMWLIIKLKWRMLITIIRFIIIITLLIIIFIIIIIIFIINIIMGFRPQVVPWILLPCICSPSRRLCPSRRGFLWEFVAGLLTAPCGDALLSVRLSSLKLAYSLWRSKRWRL